MSEKQKQDSINRKRMYQDAGAKMAMLGDIELAFFCALYWGEGDKHDNMFSVTNMDVDLLKIMVKVLKEKFLVPEEKIIIRLQYFPSEITLDECVNYWKMQLSIPNAKVYKPTIKIKKSDNVKNLHGVCAIRVNDTQLIHTVYGAIKKFGNLPLEKWL